MRWSFALAGVVVVPVACTLDQAGIAEPVEDDGAAAASSSASSASTGEASSTSTTVTSADGSTVAGSGGQGGAVGTGGDGAGAGGDGGDGGDGGSPPAADCPNGIIEEGEECDGDWPCVGCQMICPDGWVEGAATHTCYARNDGVDEFSDMADTCTDLGDLEDFPAGAVQPATPDVEGDIAAVVTACGDEVGDDGCWIGAHDPVENTFVWVDMDPFTYDFGMAPWHAGEPNDASLEHDEDCLELYVGDEDPPARPLRDAPCDDLKRTICEIAPPGTPG